LIPGIFFLFVFIFLYMLCIFLYYMFSFLASDNACQTRDTPCILYVFSVIYYVLPFILCILYIFLLASNDDLIPQVYCSYCMYFPWYINPRYIVIIVCVFLDVYYVFFFYPLHITYFPFFSE
jgi:hypothetical protein